jgi:hypothetical protein
MTVAFMPTLLADRGGYALGDEVVEGFADRPELDAAQRARIARWADRFGGGQSDVQPTAAPASPALDPETESLATGLIADRQELQELHLSGLLDELDEQQRGWLAHPQTHPLVGGRYPLSVGALAVLADSSEDQVRRWADSGVLPSFRVGVERRFGRAGAARAMLLASASKPEKAVLSAVSQGQGRRVMLLLGAVVEDALARGEGLGSAERGQLAAALRAAADRLAPKAKSSRGPVAKAPKGAKRKTLKVLARDGSWVVVAANNRPVAAAAKQSDAVKAARERLRQSGGGELQVVGRSAVRRYPVTGERSGGLRPRRAKAAR